MVPRLVTYNSYMPSFQYKIFSSFMTEFNNDFFFIIKNFILFIPSLLYSFCKLYDETPFHIFYEYNCVTCLSSELVQWLQNILILHILTPLNHFYHLRLPFLRSLMLQTMTPFFKKIVFINHILLIFKLYVYNSREKRLININSLIAEIGKVKGKKNKWLEPTQRK